MDSNVCCKREKAMGGDIVVEKSLILWFTENSFIELENPVACSAGTSSCNCCMSWLHEIMQEILQSIVQC